MAKMSKSTKSSKGPAMKPTTHIPPKAASKSASPKSAPAKGLKGNC